MRPISKPNKFQQAILDWKYCVDEKLGILQTRDNELEAAVNAIDLDPLEDADVAMQAAIDALELADTAIEGDIATINDTLELMAFARVELTTGDGNVISFRPSTNTAAANTAALRAALEAADSQGECVVYLLSGQFDVAAGNPLINSAASADVWIDFHGDARIVYADPEDASEDSSLYRGDRDATRFGAVDVLYGGTVVPSHQAIQAAMNSLPLFPDNPAYLGLTSGRMMRTGTVTLPNGNFYLGGQIFLSPTVNFTGRSFRGTVLHLINGTFTNPADEKFTIMWDAPLIVDVNNTFGTAVTNMALSCGSAASNLGASGIFIQGGQGLALNSIFVIGFSLRGVSIAGGRLGIVWIANTTRGPGLDWSGSGHADLLSVEHVNGAGTVDPATGRVYPAVRMVAGFYHVDVLAGEEEGSTAQTLVEVGGAVSTDGVVGATFGQILMGIGTTGPARTHTLLRVVGDSQCVNVQQIYGTQNGFFPANPGTLVYDDSDFSPAGAGVPTILTGARGTYNQNAAAGADLTSGPVTSSGGVSAIADGALSIAKTSGLQTALDGKSDTSHAHTFASLTSKPTTLAGYGITDAPTGSGTSTGTNTGDQDLSGYVTKSSLLGNIYATATFQNLP